MLSFAALVIDRNGSVVATTAAADDILKTGEFIVLRNGRLEGVASYDTQKIDDAFAKFLAGRCSTAQTFVLTGTRGNIASFHISPLRAAEDILGNAVAIIGIEPLNASARALDQLTGAETEVAVALLSGARALEIASQRNVSIETVRSQIKSIYSKFEVRGHVELIAALSRET